MCPPTLDNFSYLIKFRPVHPHAEPCIALHFPVEHASTDTQEASVASHERGSNLLELKVTGQALVNCDSRDLASPRTGASEPALLGPGNGVTNYCSRNGTQSAFADLETSGTTSDHGCSTMDVEAYGVGWKVAPVPNCLNGIPRTHHWGSLGWAGQKLSAGSISAANEDDFIVQYFYSTFPMLHLSRIVSMTDKVFLGKGRRSTTCGEVLRFFILLVLMTRFEFGSRRDFWSKTSRTKYCMLPNFTETIGRTRFDALYSCLAYSTQPDEDACLSSVEHRWALINDWWRPSMTTDCRALRGKTVRPSQAEHRAFRGAGSDSGDHLWGNRHEIRARSAVGN